ncbi:hypothetical protein BLNAU_20303 [Blattamonas nauphoetae]|uniref:Uncharacterized protein n=1 Tax=Blattamonas nauphoetae TaxID=2049346 RepID=A0ABQ9X393_9EUKA|nr:hypothetical protein BLNAU_20303 [Blattamonas nauphoetae]
MAVNAFSKKQQQLPRREWLSNNTIQKCQRRGNNPNKNSRSGDKGVDRHMSNDGQSGNYTIDPRKKNAIAIIRFSAESKSGSSPKAKPAITQTSLQVDENPPVFDADPSFLEYVEEITGGHFPHVLAPPGSRGPFNVGLVDRHQKDLPSPPKDPFAGGGYRKKGKKGQPAPKVTVTPLPQQDTPALSELQGGTFIVQARFTDTNTTHKFTMREGSTLGDLEREIVTLLQTKKVDISQPFPRVVFSAGDRKKTLAELNLKNASVIVKVV